MEFTMQIFVTALSLILNILATSANEKQEIVKKLQDREIQVIAPASGVDPAVLPEIKSEFQLNLNYPEDLINTSVLFHSNTDEYRANHLKSVLSAEGEDTIVWCVRGGYGTARIIETLFDIPKPAEEKVVIGYSDITALHLFLSQQWGWKSIHSQILTDLINDDKSSETLSQLVDVITGNVTDYVLGDLRPMNDKASTLKVTKGKITGGNISLLQTSIGTRWEIDANSKILFMEDVHEDGYVLDRILNHLKQAGTFDTVIAIVFGEFADPGDDNVDYALDRFAKNINAPVFKSNKFGHGFYNFPIIYNADVEINCENGTPCDLIVNVN